MKKHNLILSYFICLLLLLFLDCQDEVNENPPPGIVSIIHRSGDLDTLERGIDAIPEENVIYLEWRPVSHQDLKGYAIYRSQQADRNFNNIGKVNKIFGVIDTSYTDNTVNINIRYYYYVRAYDEMDQFGVPSDTVDYQLAEKPVLELPIQNVVTTSTPVFQWSYPSIPYDDYIFHLQKENISGGYNYFQGTKHHDNIINYSGIETLNLNDLDLDPLPNGRYRWRIDQFIPGANQGAESNWGYFTVQ